MKCKASLLALFSIIFSAGVFAQDINGPTTSKPEAVKFADIGPVKTATIERTVKDFYEKLRADGSSQGFIINYGTAKAIRTRRQAIMKGINWRCYDCPRITFVDGPVEAKVRSAFWIVPPGADNPAP